ncbi:MAG: type II secretion system F family protein [Thermodesulfovibrionales bacterium]|nr:type II secretion system F family protein [Thermodesulfovibrionales bacterium]
MPIYKYKGYKAGGADASGTIEAEGPRDAAIKLKEQGLFPRDIQAVEHRRATAFAARVDRGRVPEITRQLGVLVGSGVPVVEALRALSEESQGRVRALLVDLREKVAAGGTLSRAIESHPGMFPDFYRHMLSAAEESGTLDTTLGRLADFLEGQERLKDKVRTAMIYPLIMVFVAFIVMLLLFTFVVPKIVIVFQNNEAALPLATVILIWLSDTFVNYWWAIIALLIAGSYTGQSLFRKHRAKADRLLMRVLGSLYLARYTRTLSLLLEGGLPVIRAMELAGRSSGNAWVEGTSREATIKVSEGASLAVALEGMPPVMRELIATGERSGKLAVVLGRAADSYENEFERLVQRSLAYLEPGMILAMAAVVAFIVFSVLLPLFQMNQLIK